MKRIIPLLCAVAMVVIGSVGFAVNHVYDTTRELSEHIYDPSPIIHQTFNDEQQTIALKTTENDKNEQQFVEMQVVEKQVNLRQPFTILIMGIDQRPGDSGRADVLIVAAVNPNDSSTSIMNIPRDTRTTIVGKSREDKVNHSYAYGGTAMTIATVEQLIGIPIDYYIKVDMEGFQQIIDTLGGVEVKNPLKFSYEGYDFPKGDLALQGKEALAYVRMRYDDPQGDLGRNDRQKLVVESVLHKVLDMNTVFKFDKLAKTIEENVKTNLTFDEWKTMGMHYRESFKHIQMEKLNGHGQLIDGIYYYMVNDKEKQRITESLQLHLSRIE